uniref:C2H2-type domain-containing protein n=1 Tax=Oncorhynchus tshawytscha TaxID=74940 RepID=A0AAZ3QUG9_ONCTS
MSRKTPNRPGITFEVGARIEAQDYLQKWYSSRIEDIDFDEGKMLVHFDRWSHRYDEWIAWDSTRLRPLERPTLRKEGLKEEEGGGDCRSSRLDELPGCTESTEDQTELPQPRQELRDGEEVLARWTDCRYYPAKIESVNKEGIYTVQFYDGVIRCVKKIHIKSMPHDAKGQDWIALVKAASAAAKSKGSSTPRTSANSNKDRDDPHGGKSDDEDGQEELDEELQDQSDSDKLGNLSPLLPSPQQIHGPYTVSLSLSLSLLCVTSLSLSLSPVCHSLSLSCVSPLSLSLSLSLLCVTSLSLSLSLSCVSPLSLSPVWHSLSLSLSPVCHLSLSLSLLCVTSLTLSPVCHLSHSLSCVSPLSLSCVSPLTLSPVSPLSLSLLSVTSLSPVSPLTLSPVSPLSLSSVCHLSLSPVSPLSLSSVCHLSLSSVCPLSLSVMNTKWCDDPTSPNDLDLYKCKIPGCSKAFRKAKLLDYHLKYYHNADKDLQVSELPGSPDRAGRTRATSASMPTTTTLLEVPDNTKRRRTVSTSSSLYPPGYMFQLDCTGLGSCLKPPRLNRKKRSSASMSSDSTELSLPPPPQEKSFESLHDKILKKVIDKDKHLEPDVLFFWGGGFLGKKKDKERRDRKEKEHFKMKQKKKKKKRKSKQHCYSDYDDMSLSFLERSTASALHRSSSSSCSTTKHYQYPRAILSVDLTGENLSDIEFLEDSTTESLLFSGDEYNQDFDSLNMEDFQEEDEDGTQEIVRCICEMDEENGFMIQCEECMCWQHSVCMGLLEDSIPDQYICYICRDPPGQRWSAKYLHDKDWLNKGQMYGLSFLSENYSEQNCKTSVSTHQLLADVFSVNNVLHGLQLKMDILQNKHNPNLHFWARSWVNSDEDQPMGGLPDCIHLTDNSLNNQNSSKTDTYITSEHSQEGGGVGADLVVANTNPASHSTHFTAKEQEVRKVLLIFIVSYSVEHARNCLQWQMNLLTHIEDVQNQVAGRMDLIEKELDVLESWLDFTGELEPPDPLARLPQLKHRIKQLLTDLSKVQQMSTLCSV